MELQEPIVVRWAAAPRDLARVVVACRDEVLTGVSATPTTTVRQTPYAEGALTALAESGYATVLLASAPAVARGEVSVEGTVAFNEQALTVLDPDRLLVDYLILCPHRTTEACGCSRTGVAGIRWLEAQTGQTVASGWFIGDERADLECGRALGLNTALVATDHGVATWDSLPSTERHLVDLRASRFCEAVRHLLLE